MTIPVRLVLYIFGDCRVQNELKDVRTAAEGEKTLLESSKNKLENELSSANAARNSAEACLANTTASVRVL